MDSNLPIDAHLDLIGEFRRRFPLFDVIVGRFGEDTPTERIPWFFGFILAAATKPELGACCFVLHKTSGTTAIAAILAALVRLKDDCPQLVEHYAKTALSRGQRVKVRPSEFVYEYEGLWRDFPGFFRLKVLGEDAWRSFPLVDVLRLEPTDRVRPKGTGNSELGVFERSSLDHLLDLTTYGNNSIIRNAVLVHMARAQFGTVADAVILAPRHARRFARLSRFLPWGAVGADGRLKPNDHYQIVGEPLIAVSGVPEDLARACTTAERATKIVLVDGARRLARDLQAFDDIVDRQRLIILASPDESDDLELLRDRGCAIWQMSAGEVLVGEPSAVKRPRASLVGATVRAAEIRQKAKISVVECHDGQLQAAAAALEFVAGVVNDREDISEVEQALASLFRLLFECSECCFGVGEETARDLRIATEYTSKEARWLEPEIATRLRVAIGFLEQAIVNGNSKEKADSLLNIIGRQNGHWVLAVRSPRSADSIRKGLESLGADIPVVPIASLSADQEYGGIIVPGWPNDQRFTRLRSLAIAPDIQILAYPFERKWVLRHQLRERTRQQTERLTAEQRSTIVGVSTGFLTSFDTAAEDAREPTEISLDLPVFQLEERLSQRLRHPSIAKPGEEAREAQCVQFFGGSYALLTEWAALPLINDLIDTRVGDKAKLVSATASQLKMGDFVLFRAGGDKEFTRLIAEEMLGVETYRGLREIAERWKVAIRRLGSSPAIVQRRLSDYGLDRTLPTVAGWCGDPSRIGPGELTDIDVIAKAAKDKELEATGDEVKEAISRVRGAHNSAGLRLTKLILGEIHDRIDQLGERPTLLDLSYGQAWVVQVGSVEPKRQPYPANQVNRLLWSADNAM